MNIAVTPYVNTRHAAQTAAMHAGEHLRLAVAVRGWTECIVYSGVKTAVKLVFGFTTVY